MNRKMVLILAISILMLFIIPSSGFAKDDRTYSISHANVDLIIQSNGLLHIDEALFYSFDGTYNGVYRNISLKQGESLSNVHVSANGAYNSFQIEDIDNNTKQIKVNLYSDIEKTKPITNKDVEVILNYDMANVTTLYNDVGVVHYQLWGKSWDVGVGYVDGTVQFNSSSNVQYWINPPYAVNTTQLKGSILYLKSNKISSGNFFEIRATIPLDQFINPIFARENKTVNGLPIVTKIQKDYENEIKFKNRFYPIIAILMMLSVLIPIGAYFKYGREPKISYDGIYEREAPTNDSPAFVNSISGSGFTKVIGKPDMNGFNATIMDLINRKYLSIIPNDISESVKSINLEIDSSDLSQLKSFEKDVINFLSNYETKKGIDLNMMSRRLSEKNEAIAFKNRYNSWINDFKQIYWTNESVNDFFIDTGTKIMKAYGVAAVALGVIVGSFTFTDSIPVAGEMFFSAAVLVIIGIVSFIMPEKVGGRWTEYGRAYDKKWQNFKKYLKDFSLIKEYPPESVAVWNQYLVYATALGVADEVKKSMEKFLPSDVLNTSDTFMFYHYGGYYLMSSSFNQSITTATGGNSGGGLGGAGGGSGGGGGGAF